MDKVELSKDAIEVNVYFFALKSFAKFRKSYPPQVIHLAERYRMLLQTPNEKSIKLSGFKRGTP